MKNILKGIIIGFSISLIVLTFLKKEKDEEEILMMVRETTSNGKHSLVDFLEQHFGTPRVAWPKKEMKYQVEGCKWLGPKTILIIEKNGVQTIKIERTNK